MKMIPNIYLGQTAMRRTIIAVLVFAFMVAGVMGVMGVTGASASGKSGDIEYRYLAAAGMFDGGFLCAGGGNPPCPDAAKASDGIFENDTIELVGEGTFMLKGKKGKLKPKKGKMGITGGGSFRHLFPDGAVRGSGTWTAKKLISFESFGPSPCVPGNTLAACDGGAIVFPFPTAEAGNALIEVELVSDETGMRSRAVLTVGCILPGILDLPPELIEGIRINLTGASDFDLPPDADPLRSTLFIRLGGR